MWFFYITVILVSIFGGDSVPAEIPSSGALYNATNHFHLNVTEENLLLRQFNITGNGTRIPIKEGICYIEVPTASLVKDRSHVPAGNGSNPTLSVIRTCCAGFRRHPHIFRRCEPVCARPCGAGVCSAPDTCTCFDSHVHNKASFCVATCPVSCQNGRCAGDQCICDPGYTLDQGGKFCAPLCRDNCGGHGNCTAPNVCDCPPEFPPNADGVCHAACPGCENGDCLGPNQCRCHRGYVRNNQRQQCEPVCSKGCTNGICVAPETCSCEAGFDYDATLGLCNPRCLQHCFNALCTGPDTCTCKNGYVKDDRNPLGNVCKPHCPSGCPNGTCSNPNFCLCNAGYIKDRSVRGSQACVKAPGGR